MQFRHQYPMVRLLLPFIIGIIAAIGLDSSTLLFLPGMAAILVILTVWIIRNPRKANYRVRWIFGFAVNILLFFIGYNLLLLNKQNNDQYHFSRLQPLMMLATPADAPREKAHSWKMVVRVTGVKQGVHFVPVRGNLLVYFAKDPGVKVPGFGDILLISGKPTDIQPPLNPGSFNYKRYLEYNAIYHQLYLKTGSWKCIGHRKSFSIKNLSLKIRAYSLDILERSHLDGKEFAIAAALLLGQDEILDAETRQEYSSAGVVHILGISGLHVGIIYLVLNFLFGFLDKFKEGRSFKLVMVISLIWFYALITGLSPAALRSSAMFTFVALGNLGKQNVHIFNSLATSALVLLLFNPFLIMNIGFQFSYIAVAGIVLFHPSIYKLWEPGYWLVDQTWSLVAMSLAAQFVTFPLTLYYFHQFPVYFLPANLIAIPLSNAVIYSGMAILGTSFLPFISNNLGLLTYYLIRLLNTSVHWIESLPCSVIHNIQFDLAQTFLIYILITSLSTYFYQLRKVFLFVAVSSLMIFVCLQSYRSFHQEHQHKLVVYYANKHTITGVITAKNCILLTDSSLLTDPKLLDITYGGSKPEFGINHTVTTGLNSPKEKNTGDSMILIVKGRFTTYIQSRQNRIAIISGKMNYRNPGKKVKLDYLILTGNVPAKLDKVLGCYSPGMILIDGSCSSSRSSRWQEECISAGIPVYNVKKSGAYIVDLK